MQKDLETLIDACNAGELEEEEAEALYARLADELLRSIEPDSTLDKLLSLPILNGIDSPLWESAKSRLMLRILDNLPEGERNVLLELIGQASSRLQRALDLLEEEDSAEAVKKALRQ